MNYKFKKGDRVYIKADPWYKSIPPTEICKITKVGIKISWVYVPVRRSEWAVYNEWIQPALSNKQLEFDFMTN